MDAPDQRRAQRRVNGTVPLDPAHGTKGGRGDADAPMRPAPFPPAPVAPMFVALVKDIEPRGGEGRLEPLAHFLCKFHLFDQAPFYPALR